MFTLLTACLFAYSVMYSSDFAIINQYKMTKFVYKMTKFVSSRHPACIGDLASIRTSDLGSWLVSEAKKLYGTKQASMTSKT